MTPQGPISRELQPYVDQHESELIERVGQRLMEERPAPPARFEAELRSRLAALANTPGSMGPRRLALAVAVNVSAGFVLLAVAAAGLAGAGPLAP
jgi:hypothetical protein